VGAAAAARDAAGGVGVEEPQRIMGLARRATMLVAFLLLISAVMAYAESAWVLWTKETATRPEVLREEEKKWSRMAAFDTKPECVSDASTRAQGLAAVLRAAPLSGRTLEIQRYRDDYIGVKSTFSDGLSVWTFYQCWPNTVDPRGPKGK
jgi:hypothetical protein